MSPFQEKQKILITCPNRIAPYLRAEVENLGFPIVSEWITGIETTGTLNDTIRLNLRLRTGNQVLYLLREFKAANAGDLYEEVKNIPWEDYIEETGYLSVTSNVSNPTIDTPLFANVKCKDAIADRILSKKKIRPDSGPERNKTVIHLYWKDSDAAIYIDSSGETLAKHGYRKLPGKAPIQEGLAAAMILSTGWDPATPFVNPMCGSGTLAIEAALIALDRSPGLYRANYGFMHIKGYEEDVYLEERKKIREQVKKTLNSPIIATDISREAVEGAKRNAATAGVDQLIGFRVCDFAETAVPEGNGVVIFNPEYGERMGDYDELEALYKRIGDFMKQKCKGYRAYLLTSSPNLTKKIGLQASRKIPFYNSKLDCRLLEYEIYEGSRREPKIISDTN